MCRLCANSTVTKATKPDWPVPTLAQRAGMSGIQEWLSFYFKSPMAARGLVPENDLFIQQTKFKNTLRWLMGEDQITHLGVEYYEYDQE